MVEWRSSCFSLTVVFKFRCTTEILSDARSISEHAGKKQIEESDIQFAIDNSGKDFIYSPLN